jgi:cysteinyl-tRNA synthetase
MEEREAARASKDFERADALRDRLAEMGWEVRDSAEGPSLVPRA